MTRTSRLKLLYVLALVVLGVLAGAIIFWVLPEHRVLAIIVLALLLFIPGRVQGTLFREHFRGRRLADLGKFEESIRASEAFLATISKEPWRKKAVWLGGVIYSPDIEAMTRNNIGVAAMQLGDIAKADLAFREALAVDREYPIPHFNLAVLATAGGDDVTASRELAEATRLGYEASRSDAVIRSAQQVLAVIESRRRSAS